MAVPEASPTDKDLGASRGGPAPVVGSPFNSSPLACSLTVTIAMLPSDYPRVPSPAWTPHGAPSGALIAQVGAGRPSMSLGSAQRQMAIMLSARQ
jgi:hypothetical protein